MSDEEMITPDPGGTERFVSPETSDDEYSAARSAAPITTDLTVRSIKEMKLVIGKINKNEPKTDNSIPRVMINEFSDSDIGPFQVIIESTDQNIGRIHPMKLGRIIKINFEGLKNNIKDISFAGQKRIKIDFDSARAANLFIKSKWVKDSHYKTFIPFHLVSRQGVIRNVDSEIDENYILDNIDAGPFQIIEAKRMKRKLIENGQVKYVPTGTVILRFRGTFLPNEVSIDYQKCKVQPFIQKVTICYKCLGYNHVSQQCRGTSKCPNGCEQHEGNICPRKESPVCIYCEAPKNNHSALSQECPRFVFEKNIKMKMAYENVPYRAAKEQLLRKDYSEVLKSNKFEFPPLSERQLSIINDNPNAFNNKYEQSKHYNTRNVTDYISNRTYKRKNTQSTNISNCSNSYENKRPKTFSRYNQNKFTYNTKENLERRVNENVKIPRQQINEESLESILNQITCKIIQTSEKNGNSPLELINNIRDYFVVNNSSQNYGTTVPNNSSMELPVSSCK